MALSLSRINFFICLKLLRALKDEGLEHVILCPGSRSGPLAFAAAGLREDCELNVYTAIDERSAAFLALGISAAIGKASAVITTSGSAVANLLPAAVEADRSCLPIVLITADRPLRLKRCGANQAVNQEDFLDSVSRKVISSPEHGIHLLKSSSLNYLVADTWNYAHSYPGPIHLNLHIEEPLHPSFLEQKEVWDGWEPNSFNDEVSSSSLIDPISNKNYELSHLDISKLGIILVGPWRGGFSKVNNFKTALSDLQNITGWPVFADCLSQISEDQEGLIEHWQLLISSGAIQPDEDMQIIRLGPLSSGRAIDNFIRNISCKQILITEGEYRYLDPARLADQFSEGLFNWMKYFRLKFPNSSISTNSSKSKFLKDLLYKSDQIDAFLDRNLKSKGFINEPSLARYLPRILKSDLPIMLSASSPIRDYETFSGLLGLHRKCFSFRGTSGIDGNLSMAIGLSIAMGPMVVICGDLAFFYDSNAFLLKQPTDFPLIILLIDNKGGGIFKQINLDSFYKGDLDEVFSMPQSISPIDLASSYKIPSKDIKSFDELESALGWAMKLCGPVLIRICTNSSSDNQLRKSINAGLKEIFKLSVEDE